MGLRVSLVRDEGALWGIKVLYVRRMCERGVKMNLVRNKGACEVKGQKREKNVKKRQ